MHIALTSFFALATSLFLACHAQAQAQTQAQAQVPSAGCASSVETNRRCAVHRRAGSVGPRAVAATPIWC